MDGRNRALWLVWIVPAVALIVALADLPYGYYTLLRITVTICAGVIIYIAYQSCGTLTPSIIFFGGITLLFNPIAPVHLTREIWAPIDIATAIVFIAHFVLSLRADLKPESKI